MLKFNAKKKIKNLLIKLPNKVNRIIKSIDQNGLGIVFIIDSKKAYWIYIRWRYKKVLFKKKKLPENVKWNSSIVNKKPFSLQVTTDIQKILSYLEPKAIKSKITIKCIPLLDKTVVDIATSEKPREYPIAQPDISQREIKNTIQAIKSGWISSKGAYILAFEKNLQNS